MKRFLLTMSVALFATTMFAQVVELANHEREQLLNPQASVMGVANEASAVDVNATTKRQTKATGLYYGKPVNMMYENYYSETGSGYYNSWYRVPYFADFKYINLSNSPTTTEWVYSVVSSGTETTHNSLSSGKDSEGNYTQSLTPGYLTYALRLYNSTGSEFYNMAYYDNDTEAHHGYYNHPVYGSDEMCWLGFVDNKSSTGFNSTQTTNGYVMGSTTLKNAEISYIDANGDKGTLEGDFPISYVYQEFPAPPAPMYVENVWMRVLQDGTDFKPFKNGGTLTMEIYNSETEELMQTLTASADGVLDWKSTYSTTYTPSGNYCQGCISFSYVEDDPIFGLIAVPFVIDYPSIVYVLGFDNDGVDVGLSLHPIQDCDITEGLEVGRMVPYDPEHPDYTFTSAYGYADRAINMMFNGLMDTADVPETFYWGDAYGNITATVSDYNVIRISDDGKSCAPDIDENYIFADGLYLQTACEWFDEDNKNLEYYYFSDLSDSDRLPDWVTGVSLEEYQEGAYFLNEYIASFTASAISSGEGRGVIVYLKGRGYTNPTPVYLLQGNITKDDIVPTGISTVTNTNETKTTLTGTYNLAGQRVSESTKGVLVRDGKKFIAK